VTKLVEDKLQIDFVGALHVMKFDQNDPNQPDYHDLQNMPRVDFIVEMENEIYFIEVKDPNRPNAVDVGSKKFLVKLQQGELAKSLYSKYISSFFFRWAECHLEKSVHYISLINLESALLQPLIDDLGRQFMYLSKKSVRWHREPLASWQIHNIKTWQAVFPLWPVTRLP